MSAAPESVRRLQRRHLPRLAAAIIALVVMPLVLPAYPLALVTLALGYGLFAFGLDIAWGRVGIVSVGHAAFFGIGAYGAAVAQSSDISIWVGILCGVSIASAIALGIGMVGLNSRAIATTMAVLTLGITLLASQVATSWRSVTNGSNGIFVTSTGLVSNYYVTAAFVAVVTALVWFFVIRGSLGRKFLAVLLNQERASHLGVDPFSTKLVAFVISGAVAAAAGGISAPAMGLVGPSSAGIVLSTQVLVWLAIGGRGTIIGPFLGAIIVTVGQEYLGSAIGSWYQLLMGAAFILVVRFAPSGLVGIARRWMKKGASEPSASAVILDRPTPPSLSTRAASHLPPGSAAMEIGNARKSFQHMKVLSGVSVRVAPGEIVCLIGPNGAGKTTLLNLIAGSLSSDSDSGKTLIYGTDVTHASPSSRAHAGLGRVFQIPSVFFELSPADNILLSQSLAQSPSHIPAEYDRFSAMTEFPASQLPLADKRALELAMVMVWGPQVLLLDEPAAGLSHQDSTALAAALRRISKESGVSMLIVEHDMDIVRDLADRVVVLAEGVLLVDGSMDEVSNNEEVRRAYLGAV
jgi:branched-chain amino acid transport system permease protein